MRAFIIGIDGFAGRHLTARLAAAGHAVEGTSLAEGAAVEGAERVTACDVRNGEGVGRAVREARADAVVHLAGQTSVAASFARPAETFEVNALGALHVLEACRRSGVGRVLLVTSCEVYGVRDPADGPVPESARLAPVSPYGSSKAAQDLLGEQYERAFGLAVLRARSFPHTGPGQAAGFLFPSVARRIAQLERNGAPAEIRVGDLGVTRDLLDVRDVGDAYAALLEHPKAAGAYNVCGGRGRTLASALEVLCGLSRRPVRLVQDPALARPVEIRWMVGDPARLAGETGWSPRRTWEETMADLLDDWRARARVKQEERSPT